MVLPKHLPAVAVALIATTSLLHAKPNIIFILTDDLGYGDLGVLHQQSRDDGSGTGGVANDGIINGDEKFVITPNLDTMAGEGTILNRHYCPAPVCAPSRGSLLSGMHQGHANVRNRQFDKAIEDNHNLATTLKSAGYHTAIIGKYGLQGTSGSSPSTWPAYPTKRGFDYFYGYATHVAGHQHYPGNTWALGNSNQHRSPQDLYENDTEISSQLDKCYTTDLFTARAKKLIIDQTTNSPSQPFFLYLAYDTPHAALQLPTMEFPSGKGVSGGLQWNGTSGNMINTASGVIDSYINPLYSGKGWNNTHERFATMVTRIDHCVGDLLQTLKDLNIDDNTIVIFSSDNGPHKESYISGANYSPTAFDSYGPLEGEKQDAFEGGIRVPTLSWGPGNIQAGAISNHPSQFHDWMATFLDYADITAPARTDGVSLIPTLSGAGSQAQGIVYVEYDASGSMGNYADFTNHGGTTRNESQAIYLDGYKGIRTNVTSHSVDFQIYDTLTDLSEANNLAGTSAYFISLQQRMKDEVLRIRQPDSSAKRAYDGEFVPPVFPAVESGIEVKTFEGTWTWVPEFEQLAETSATTAPNISTAHLSRSTDAGLLYTGYINVPTNDTWTFYTTSDAGTLLRIHDSLVIDDDFNHDGSETSGTIKLAAGKHPFRLYYRNTDETPTLDFKWSSSSTSKETVPDSALYRDGSPAPEPLALNDSAATSGTNQLSIPVLNNDSDDGQPASLSIQSVSQSSFGTTLISGTNILYTADSGKYGIDQFDYTITDGLYTATATVTIDVTVPTNELWFPLNETTGNSVAEAGGVMAGTHSGIADSEAAHIVAKHGYGLSFDGTDDQINLSGLTLPTGSSPRTISAWIRKPEGANSENQVIFGYGANTNGTRFSFRTSNEADQYLRVEVQGGYILANKTKLNDGQWHHVAVVIEDGVTNITGAKLYVDGVLETIDSSGSRTLDTSSSGAPVIGGSTHADNYNFKGDIDEVHVFASAKSAAEITTLASAYDQTSRSWLYRHFGNTSPAWTSDEDGDGSNLLSEYAFGYDPHQPDQASIPATAIYNATNDKLEVSYTRRKAGTHQLIYTVEVSDDLNTWTLPSTELTTIAHPTLGSDFIQVVVETDALISTSSRQFIRIKVE